MLIFLSVVPVVLVLAWLVAEARGRRWVRVLTGLAALIAIAIVSFLWGGFAEALKHSGFPVPHDSPADAALMDRIDQVGTVRVVVQETSKSEQLREDLIKEL